MTAPAVEGRALTALLGRLAAAKHELGFRCAYWAGRGPSVDASIALAGMALEEEGHAKVLEGFLADELGGPPMDRDALVRWDRWPSVPDTSRHRDDTWPETVVRYFAQDVETTAALQALAQSPLSRLADRARKMVEEEQFHALFSLETLRTIASISPEAGERVSSDLARLWQDRLESGNLQAALGAVIEERNLPSEALSVYRRHRDESIAAARAALDPQLVSDRPQR